MKTRVVLSILGVGFWTVLAASGCAKAEGGGTASGDGDGDSSASGGDGSDDAATGGSASGGTSSSSGGMGQGGENRAPSCTTGQRADCRLIEPGSLGVAECVQQQWDLSGCISCEPGEVVPCAEAEPSLPEGSATCNEDGNSYDTSACTECEQGVDFRSCSDEGNSTNAKAGNALCGAEGYDWSTCKICEAGDTLSCAEVPGNVTFLAGDAVCDPSGNDGHGSWDTSTCALCEAAADTIDCTEILGGAHEYTAGTALCNSEGTGWDEASCEYCGDGVINGALEECDGADVPAQTCVGYGLPEGDSGGANLACRVDTCEFDTSVCSACGLGIEPDNCLEGGSCSGPTDCSGVQCGSMSTCSFSCGNGQICDTLSCGEDATCNISCGSESASCSAVCHDGSTCNSSASNGGDLVLDCEEGTTCFAACGSNATCSLTCAAGSDCQNTAEGGGAAVTYNCAAGSSCDVTCGNPDGACNVNCAPGSACSVNATRGIGVNPSGTAYCADAECDYAFNGQGTIALQIVCQAGGTCSVQTDAGSTTVGVIRCEAGSSCDIQCNGANNNCSYMCDPSLEAIDCACSGNGNCVEQPWTP